MPEQQEKIWWDDPKYTRKAHSSEKFCSHDYRKIEMHWDIPMILAEHRKQIVKEIRCEIEGLWNGNIFQQDMATTLRRSGFDEAKQFILSLPCLKENE